MADIIKELRAKIAELEKNIESYKEKDSQMNDEIIHKPCNIQINKMKIYIQNYQQALKTEKERSIDLEDKMKTLRERSTQIYIENAGNLDLIKSLQSASKSYEEKSNSLNSELSDLKEKYKSLVLSNDEHISKISQLDLKIIQLTKILKEKEDILYKRGQTDQTIFLNKPSEARFF